MTNAAMHTVEHLFATFVRNGEYKDEVIYFGPMGCRTGFYLLLRDTVSQEDALQLTKDAFAFIEHDLAAAKKEAHTMQEVLSDWTLADFIYPD